MARKKHKKRRPVAPLPLARMQLLWRLGKKVVPSKTRYSRKLKHKAAGDDG